MKKQTKAMKQEQKHLNPKLTSKPDQDKRSGVVLLEHPENGGLTVSLSFEKVFLDIASLFVEETNRYADADKQKPRVIKGL